MTDARMEKGRAFYLAMYEKDGATWLANEHQELWCQKAEDYEHRLGPAQLPDRETIARVMWMQFCPGLEASDQDKNNYLECADEILSAAHPSGGVAEALREIEAEAARYAAMYPAGSDGRNTFVIFAEMVQRKIAALSSARAEAWQPIESKPLWQTCEERGIYTYDGDELFYFKATHWRPLPAPPMPEDLSDGHLNAGDGE